MKILVVEDTRIILSVIETILTQDKHEVYTASDGRAGTNAFYEVLPEMVVTDIEMPWLDGLSMMNVIRKTHPDVYTIYMTGNPGHYQQRLEEAQKTYPSVVVPKPFTRGDILRAVTDAVMQPSPVREPAVQPLHKEAHPLQGRKGTGIQSLSCARFQERHHHAIGHHFLADWGYREAFRSGSGK